MKDELILALRAARDFRPDRYFPLALGADGIGWVRREDAARLREWPDVFKVSDGEVQVRPAEEPALSAAFARVAKALALAGLVRGWRGETFAIRAQGDGDALFHIERAAVRFFGLTSSAAHLNGFFLQNRDPMVWIARRASTKAIEPGMLDNLVAGGVPSAEDAWQTLQRECGEEAGIPAAFAANARPAGTLRICRNLPEGLNSEVLHVYDLALPPDFVPRNMDGEVSEFQMLGAAQVLERMARGEMTAAAALVTADFAIRYGMLPDESGEIRAALDTCREPRPA